MRCCFLVYTEILVPVHSLLVSGVGHLLLHTVLLLMMFWKLLYIFLCLLCVCSLVTLIFLQKLCCIVDGNSQSMPYIFHCTIVINTINNWIINTGGDISKEKIELIYFTRIANISPISLNNTNLNFTTTYKFLDFTIDSPQLTWRKYINNLTNSRNKTRCNKNNSRKALRCINKTGKDVLHFLHKNPNWLYSSHIWISFQNNP